MQVRITILGDRAQAIKKEAEASLDQMRAICPPSGMGVMRSLPQLHLRSHALLLRARVRASA